jgi:YegS/Rv2252/BmrU family lipid kinase
VLLIANPGSRRGAILAARAERAMRKAGADVAVHLTRGPGDGARVARERASEFAAVFTLGGDGTAIEVIEALGGTETPVGVLPGGTGNLVARSMGTPLDLWRAVPALLHGEVALIDLGIINDRQPFAFTLGIGLDVRMIEGASPRLKRRLGVGAYVISASRAILKRDIFRVRITVDGVTVERDATSVMIANFGSVLSDLLHLGPGIESDDGMLDLCVFTPGTFRDACAIAWRLMRKDFSPHPGMWYKQGRVFHIECDPPQDVQSDGELRGTTPIDVRVAPRAARLLRPRRAERDETLTSSRSAGATR